MGWVDGQRGPEARDAALPGGRHTPEQRQEIFPPVEGHPWTPTRNVEPSMS